MAPNLIAILVSVVVAIAVSTWGVWYVLYVQKRKKNNE